MSWWEGHKEDGESLSLLEELKVTEGKLTRQQGHLADEVEVVSKASSLRLYEAHPERKILVQFDRDVVSKLLTRGLKVTELDSNMNSDTSYLHDPQKVIYSLGSISSSGSYRMKTTCRVAVKVK